MASSARSAAIAGESDSGAESAGGVSFHQLEAIAEWIGDEKAAESGERLVFDNRDPGTEEFAFQLGKSLDDEGGMCLMSRYEFVVDAEVHLQVLALEPAAATLRELRGFRERAGCREVPRKTSVPLPLCQEAWRAAHVRDE